MTARTEAPAWEEIALSLLPSGAMLPRLVPGSLTPVWRVKTIGDHHVQIYTMFANFRIVLSRADDSSDDAGYCYFGRDPKTFALALLAAWAWDGSLEAGPPCHDKRAF